MTNSLKLVLFLFISTLVACGNNAVETAATGDKKMASVNEKPTKQTARSEAKKSKKSFKGYSVGDKATDFSLKGVDGNMHSLSDMTDVKGYIVIFTCNHCPYSVMYEDRIIALHNKYATQGYPVVAINPNDPKVEPEDGYEEMKVRAKEKSFPFHYLFDEGQKIYPQYGAIRTPQVYLLDKDRMLVYTGAVDSSPRDINNIEHKYVEDAIAALEKGEKPDPNTTKAIGCSIKKVQKR